MSSRPFPVSAVAMLCGTLFLADVAPAAPEDDARAAVQTAVDEFLAVLADDALEWGARRERLQGVVENRFDLERMSKLVLGRSRRKLSAEQQTDFTQEFMRHLTLTYGGRIERYAQETVEVVDARTERNADITVLTRIRGGDADGLAIDFRMRNRDGSGWSGIDIIIEGVSLVQNLRAQVKEIVSQRGADELIQVLRERNDETAAQAEKAADSAGS